jgi:hypothetical protein
MRSTSARRAEENGWHGGRSLRELLAQGERPDRSTLVDWGCQLLETLARAHARGVLHRHVTEDEVVVTAEGRVVLSGFGLQRLFCDLRAPMPPEQLAGQPYSARSDLYTVGLLLRRLAFAGALHGCRDGLRKRDPLLKVLARATFTDPAGRYESAGEMAEALREAGRAGEAGRLRQRAAGAGSSARVTPFPGASLRLVPVPAPRPRQRAEPELWKLLLLTTVLLLLAVFVLTTGWFLLGRDGSYWPAGAPSTHVRSSPDAARRP